MQASPSSIRLPFTLQSAQRKKSLVGFRGLSLGRQYEPATDMVSEARGYDHGSADVQNSAEEDQSLECPRQLFSLELPGTQVFAAIQLASHLKFACFQ